LTTHPNFESLLRHRCIPKNIYNPKLRRRWRQFACTARSAAEDAGNPWYGRHDTEQCKQWCCGMFFFGWVGTAQAILTITGPPPLGEVALNLQDLQLVSLTILSNMRKIAKLDCIDVLGYSVDELGYPNHMTHTHAHIHACARTHTHTLTHTHKHTWSPWPQPVPASGHCRR
jgi:hypothetical protein